MKGLLEIDSDVAAALDRGQPVVALESAMVSHGLPHPANIETARRLHAVVREAGAVPATIGIAGGRLRVGLGDRELERFAGDEGVVKVSLCDLASVIASGGDGATTVAATLVGAALAGIRVFATGGIGGVHRGGETTLDVSADLFELARQPVAVVSAGAKSILDLPRTLEVLESLGVPVVGYGSDTLPAFYSRDSGIALSARVDSPAAAARLMHAQWSLGLRSGLLFANPPPEATALGTAEVERLVARAMARAEAAGIKGKDLTPFLLASMAAESGGATLAANIGLIEHNARLAAQIAVAYADIEGGQEPA